MFKKLVIVLAMTFAILLLPLGSVVHADDSTTSDYDYLYTTQDSSTTTRTLTDEEAAQAAAILSVFGGAFLIVALIGGLIGYVYGGLTLMATAQKLKVENAWMAWVPVLNIYITAKCADVNPWTILLLLVPVVNIVYAIYLYMKISERRGYSQWTGLLLLVPLANIVWLGVLAWGKSPSDK